MKILLIDADSTIPNLALMKLSAFYRKNHWAQVKLLRCKLPYYPNKSKCNWEIDTTGYDLIFCSVIFEGNFECIKGDRIVFGGTGVDNKIKLPEEIENMQPDYFLYKDDFTNDTSYGFLSRGCIRKCEFCQVHEKEGAIKQVSTVKEIVKHRKVRFLDNNILALPNHKEILAEVAATSVKCEFYQGLDIRLLDTENSALLSRLNYLGEYVFAFDDINLKALIEAKLSLAEWRKPWQFKFFVYVHPDMPLTHTVERIVWLKNKQLLPYVMRHISCWDSNLNAFYVDIAAYCNQVFAFKKLDFASFLLRRHDNKERINFSLKLWLDNGGL